MKTIVINYKFTSEPSIEKFHSLLDGCVSSKYKIHVNVFDFCLQKNIPTYLMPYASYVNTSIKYIPEFYESIPNADNIVLSNLIRHGDSTAFCILPENVTLFRNALDEIDFSWLNEDLNGFIYCDFHLNNIRCYVRSRAMGTQLNLPIVFWSTDKLVRHLGEENKLNIVGNNYASLHIPKSVCTVFQDEK